MANGFYGLIQPLNLRPARPILAIDDRKSDFVGNIMISTLIHLGRPQPMSFALRRFCQVWTFMEMFAQTFTDGDGGSLYNSACWGLPWTRSQFCDFNGDGNDDLTFTQWTGEILTFVGDGQGNFELVDEGTATLKVSPNAPYGWTWTTTATRTCS